MKELLNFTPVAIYTNEDNTYLVFIGRSGNCISYEAESGCSCSCTWFESIINQEALKDNSIIRIEDKEMCEEEDQHRDIFTKIYGHTLVTPFGHCDIEYRNESNGYYGGDASYMPKAEIQVVCKDSLRDPYYRPLTSFPLHEIKEMLKKGTQLYLDPNMDQPGVDIIAIVPWKNK